MTGRHHRPDTDDLADATSWLAEVAHDDAFPTETAIADATQILAPEVLALDPLYTLPHQRRQQIGLVIAGLIGRVQAWEAHGQTTHLDAYLHLVEDREQAEKARRNPHLRQYRVHREFTDAVGEYATILRYQPGPPVAALPPGVT